jgi:hypothetical protein
VADAYNFGEPDGAREDIGELGKIFVAFDDARVWGGLAIKADDMTARIIVGRKGSGKTFHLRRLRAHAAGSPELYAAQVEQSIPDSSQIVRFAYHAKGHDRTELWKLAWNRAILRATASHLLADPALYAHVDETIRWRLLGDYNEILNSSHPSPRAIGIFAQMNALLAREPSYRELDRFVHHEKWPYLEEDLSVALRECRRMCFYLDALDEYYYAAPQYWLECQVGLFYAAMDLLRDQRFGSTLHIFAALRDTVMLKVVSAPHGDRYIHERHVRNLDWDYVAAKTFLNQKIKSLDEKLLAKPEADDAVERWLGSKERYVPSRQSKEPLSQYLLRHTRLLPRDVIIQGNILCQEIARSRWLPELEPPPDPIREAVRQAAVGFGNELLHRCTSHILADMMPDEAVKHSYESNYLDRSSGLYGSVRNDVIHLLQKEVVFERLPTDKLLDLDRAGRERFSKMAGSNSVDILGALWLNGLLGYVEDDKPCVVFYSHRHAAQLAIPTHKKQYVFHSTLIDCIGLQPKGSALVSCP